MFRTGASCRAAMVAAMATFWFLAPAAAEDAPTRSLVPKEAAAPATPDGGFATVPVDPAKALTKKGNKADYRAIARSIAKEKGLPFELLDAVMRVESNYNAAARGGDGEVGLMQVMPPTARQLGFSGSLQDLADPETNIRLGARYLIEAYRRADGDTCTTVMKYRAGWGETRFSNLSVRYCVRVRQHLASLGVEPQGIVPEPTFGFKRDEFHQGVQLGSIAARRRLASGRKLKSKVNWAAYDQRMKELDRRSKVGLGN
jgi:soluble lytic murein transglycosylase-like protein